MAYFLPIGLPMDTSVFPLGLTFGGVFLLALVYAAAGLAVVSSANAALSLIHHPDTPAR